MNVSTVHHVQLSKVIQLFIALLTCCVVVVTQAKAGCAADSRRTDSAEDCIAFFDILFAPMMQYG
jgi:hypothetical protein